MNTQHEQNQSKNQKNNQSSWQVNFFNQPIFKEVCESARNSIKINDNHNAQIGSAERRLIINIGIRERVLGIKLKRCQNLIQDIAFSCKTCQLHGIQIYMCKQCFDKGQHVQKKHSISHIALPKDLTIKIRCHCGDQYLMKQEGVCQKHLQRLHNKSKQQILNNFKQHAIDCFRILFKLHKKAAKMNQVQNTCFEYGIQLMKQLYYYASIKQQKYDQIILEVMNSGIIFQNFSANPQQVKNKTPIIVCLLNCAVNSEEFWSLIKLVYRKSKSEETYPMFRFFILPYIIRKVKMMIIKGLEDSRQENYFDKIISFFQRMPQADKNIVELAKTDSLPYSQNLNNILYRITVMNFYIQTFIQWYACNVKPNNLYELWRVLEEHKLTNLKFINFQYLGYYLIFLSLPDPTDKQNLSKKIFNNLLKQFIFTYQDKKQEHAIKIVTQVVDIYEEYYQMKKKNSNEQILLENKQQILTVLNGIKELIQDNQKVKDFIDTQIEKINKKQQNNINKQNIQQQVKQIQIKIEKLTQKQTINNQEIQKKANQKKKKLTQNFKQKQKNFVIPDQILRLKSNDEVCGICRQLGTKQNPLFILGQLYSKQNYFPQLINKTIKSEYELQLCMHTLHIKCYKQAQKIDNLQKKCPLCKQNVNIILLSPNTKLSKQILQLWRQFLILEQQQNFMQLADVFKILFYILIDQVFSELVYGDRFTTKQAQSKRNITINILKKALKEIYVNLNQQQLKQLKQLPQLLLMKEQKQMQVFSNLKIFQKCEKLAFLSIKNYIFDKNQEKDIKNILNQFRNNIKNEEIERINLVISNVVNCQMHQFNQVKQNQIMQNEKKEQQKRFIFQLNHTVPKYLVYYTNNFDPICNSFKGHYSAYWVCLLCYKKFCGSCQKSTSVHSYEHQELYVPTLHVCEGNVIINFKLITKAIARFIIKQVYKKKDQISLLQFDKKLYRNAFGSWLNTLKARQGLTY